MLQQNTNPKTTNRDEFVNNWSKFLDQSVQHMLQFLNENPNIKEFVKNFNDNERGFMFSNHPYIYVIGSSPLVDQDGHTGATFACCLRECQQILNNSPPPPSV
jgi:hypothetical protein